MILQGWNMSKPNHCNWNPNSEVLGWEVIFLLCSLDSSGILVFDSMLLAFKIISTYKKLSRVLHILGIPLNMLNKMCKNSPSQGFPMSTQFSTTPWNVPKSGLDVTETLGSCSMLKQHECFKLKLYCAISAHLWYIPSCISDLFCLLILGSFLVAEEMTAITYCLQPAARGHHPEASGLNGQYILSAAMTMAACHGKVNRSWL